MYVLTDNIKIVIPPCVIKLSKVQKTEEITTLKVYREMTI